MGHRAKPYDFKNVNDINEAFKMSVCEFFDYKEYWGILSELDENFDESIEYYDTTNWLNISIGDKIDDKLLKQAIKSINDAEGVFYKLYQRSEQKCRKMLDIVIRSDEKIQMQILGHYYKYDESMIEEIFDDEGIFSLEYIYNMEEAYESFIRYINEMLSKYQDI